jgi:biotin-dependent carboxylase-like uncharacterized protein
MRTGLVVEAPGLGVTIQDRGRIGFRAMGVTASGPLDGDHAACAVLLAGGPEDAAFLEIRGLGPTLAANGGSFRLALTGQVAAEIRRRDGDSEPFRPWTTATLHDGDRVVIGLASGGPAHLAVGGGILVPPALGSRATFERAGLGGLDGRAPAKGDLLPCAPLGDAAGGDVEAPDWSFGGGPIRVIVGPQADHFTSAALDLFETAGWRVTRETDRMGMRLDGPRLDHLSPAEADIVSDGVAPGAIQVPAAGRPIVLLADCQTVGGYPKIGTVISADLPRLARVSVGDEVRFAFVDMATAVVAAAARSAALDRWRASIGPKRTIGRIDVETLWRENLVGGMVDASRPADWGENA